MNKNYYGYINKKKIIDYHIIERRSYILVKIIEGTCYFLC